MAWLAICITVAFFLMMVMALTHSGVVGFVILGVIVVGMILANREYTHYDTWAARNAEGVGVILCWIDVSAFFALLAYG